MKFEYRVHNRLLSSRRNFRNNKKKKTLLEVVECFLSSSLARLKIKFRSGSFVRAVVGVRVVEFHNSRGKFVSRFSPGRSLGILELARPPSSMQIREFTRNALPRGTSVLVELSRREQSSTKPSETRGDQYAKLVSPFFLVSKIKVSARK